MVRGMEAYCGGDGDVVCGAVGIGAQAEHLGGIQGVVEPHGGAGENRKQ